MLTLRQYAEQNHITYEAVRKQVGKHSEELKDHIVTIKGTKHLDEEAVKFLDELRNPGGTTVVVDTPDQAMQELQEENKYYMQQIITLHQKIETLQHNIDYLKDEKHKSDLALTTLQTQTKLLEEKQNESDQVVQEAVRRAEEKSKEAEKAQLEADKHRQEAEFANQRAEKEKIDAEKARQEIEKIREEAESARRESEEKEKDLEKAKQEAEQNRQEVERLKNRGLFARIFNR